MANWWFYQFTSSTYLCNHAQIINLRLVEGNMQFKVPLLVFLVCFAVFSLLGLAAYKILKILRSSSRLMTYLDSLTGWEVVLRCWYRNPLFDAVAIRTNEDERVRHEEHSMDGIRDPDNCPYCRVLAARQQESAPQQHDGNRSIYELLQLPYARPLLQHRVEEATEIINYRSFTAASRERAETHKAKLHEAIEIYIKDSEAMLEEDQLLSRARELKERLCSDWPALHRRSSI